MKLNEMKLISIAYHRNGVCGAPFYAVLFKWEGELRLACVFDEPYHVAVIDPALAAAGDIAFGSNSWRGDRAELWLRRQIKQYEKEAA